MFDVPLNETAPNEYEAFKKAIDDVDTEINRLNRIWMAAKKRNREREENYCSWKEDKEAEKETRLRKIR